MTGVHRKPGSNTYHKSCGKALIKPKRKVDGKLFIINDAETAIVNTMIAVTIHAGNH
jgi:hypothetical protein